MNIFSDFAPEYFENDIIVCPIYPKTKECKMPGWQESITYKDWESLVNKFNLGYGIGLLLGKINGLICVDIDTIDKDLQNKIDQVLPPTPLMKIGSKLKGVNRFYRYNGQITEKVKIGKCPINKDKAAIEILTNGQYTVIPPTIHPDQPESYRWYKCNGFDRDVIESLPTLDADHIQQLVALFPDESSSALSGGRNDTLKTILVSMVMNDNKSLDEIVNDIQQRDQDLFGSHPDGPLFLDRKDAGCCGDQYTTAVRFVCSNVGSLLKRRKQIIIPAPVAGQVEIIDEKEKPLTLYKEKKLPLMRGIMNDIFQTIYSGSIRQRSHVSFASTLATFSTMVGHRCRFEDVLANLFIMVIVDSGGGKNYPLKFPKYLLTKAGYGEKLIGDGFPASDSALIMGLGNQPVRIDIIDEIAGKLFSTFTRKNNNAFQTRIADIYAELYTSAFYGFEGKRLMGERKKGSNDSGVVGKCSNPFVNILGATTFEDFKEHIDDAIIKKGFGGRFLFFADDEYKPKHRERSFSIPAKLVKEVELFLKNDPPMGICVESGIFELEYADTIKEKIHAVDNLYEEKMKDLNPNDIMRPLYARAGENFIKLLQLDTVSCGQKKILSPNIEWAQEAMDTIINNEAVFLDKNVSGGYQDRLQNEFEEFVLRSGSDGVNLTEVSNGLKSLSLKSFERREVLNSLCERERITLNVETKKYYHSQFITPKVIP